MNDEFLYRLREPPREKFALALKARLDRQAYVGARPRYWRALMIAVLLGGAAYAVTMASWRAWRGTPAEPAQSAAALADESRAAPAAAPVASQASPGGRPLDTVPAESGNRSEQAEASTAPGTTQGGGEGRSAAPAAGTLAANGPQQLRRAGALLGELSHNGITVVGTGDTAAYTERAALLLGTLARPAVQILSDDEAKAFFCRSALLPDRTVRASFVLASFTRFDEQATCPDNFRFEPAEPAATFLEIEVGYEATVIARSVLYGTVDLSPRAIFLALAKDVPDRLGGPAVVPNRYRAWNEIDASIGYDRIEVLGPALDSTVGRALLDVIEDGCNGFPALAALEQTEPERHAAVCRSVRADGVYEPTDAQVVDRLQTYPTMFGVFAYDVFDRSRESLAAAAIGGIAPTPENMGANAYPAARTLYLYTKAGTDGVPGLVSLLEAYWRLPDVRLLVAPEETKRRAMRAKIAELGSPQ